jgi:hypothetical protein
MGSDDDAKALLKTMKETTKEMGKQKNVYDSIAGVTKKIRAGSQEELDDFRLMVEAMDKRSDLSGTYKKDLQDQLDLMVRLNDEYVNSYKAGGRILGELKKVTFETRKFAFTQAAIYNYGEKIAHQYRDIARDVGLSRDQAHAMGASFRAALPEVLLMGGEMSDITNTYSSFMEQSGRLRFFSEDDLVTVNSISRATKMLPSDTAKMAESFDLMGLSVETMNESLVDVYTSSQKMGLNSTKVIKTLQNNMKSMQSYSFASGVRGMTEMAKQAVKMRIDVSDVLGMADKFYQPEAALEAAANLQMLGGDIAKAFGDPFETMYLARNKPEELAKRLQEMTENMLQFNEESGQYELPAEGRMQLKAAAEQLGIMPDKMIELARQSSKIKDIKMNISGNAFDDDVREGIAGMAKMKDGKWVVDFRDEKGKPMEIDINNTGELQNAIDKGLLSEGQETEMDLFRQISLNTQTMTEKMGNQAEASRASITAAVDWHAVYEKALGPSISKMQEGTQNLVKKQIETYGNLTGLMTGQLDTFKNWVEAEVAVPNSADFIPIEGGGNVPNSDPGSGGGNIDDNTSVDIEDLLKGGGDLSMNTHNTFDPLMININITGDDNMKGIVTVEMAQVIAKQAVQQIKNNGGVTDSKEAYDNIGDNITVT